MKSRFKTFKTRTNERIDVRENKSKRTYTIKTFYKDNKTVCNIWRTYPQPKEEFNTMSYMTGNDWNYFLKSNDYYKVK
jgi:hypothetical protein